MSYPAQLTDGSYIRVASRDGQYYYDEDGNKYVRAQSGLRLKAVNPPAPVEEFAPAQVEDEPVENDGQEETEPTDDLLLDDFEATPEDDLSDDEQLQAEAEDGQIGA